MRISSVDSTDLFRGTTARPLQVIRVRLANTGPGSVGAQDTVRVTIGSTSSNVLKVAQPPTEGTLYGETTGGVVHTWSDYQNAAGRNGPSISSNQTIEVSCRADGFRVADGNTWWYRIASSPWNSAYYASADGFYNDGTDSGSLAGTPFVDLNVPIC